MMQGWETVKGCSISNVYGLSFLLLQEEGRPTFFPTLNCICTVLLKIFFKYNLIAPFLKKKKKKNKIKLCENQPTSLQQIFAATFTRIIKKTVMHAKLYHHNIEREYMSKENS